MVRSPCAAWRISCGATICSTSPACTGCWRRWVEGAPADVDSAFRVVGAAAGRQTIREFKPRKLLFNCDMQGRPERLRRVHCRDKEMHHRRHARRAEGDGRAACLAEAALDTGRRVVDAWLLACPTPLAVRNADIGRHRRRALASAAL